MSSEVTDLITALNDGTMTLDQVARSFRERAWPRTGSPEGATADADTLDDPRPYVAGSFDDVSAAFHRGDLTGEQYRVLADAAAASIDAEVRSRSGDQPGGG